MKAGPVDRSDLCTSRQLSSKSPLKPGSFLASVLPDGEALQFDAECFSDAIQLALDVKRERLAVYVPREKECTIETEYVLRLTEIAADLLCTHVIVYIEKSHSSFADWLRRLLYLGFTVHRSSKRWNDAVVEPGVVMCAFDLADSSGSSGSETGGSAVTSDDTDIGEDSDVSDSDDETL